jgi:hypothetical protein
MMRASTKWIAGPRTAWARFVLLGRPSRRLDAGLSADPILTES